MTRKTIDYTDHAAALEAVKAQAREEALEWAADFAIENHDLDAWGISAAIRAGKVQPGKGGGA